MNVTEPWNLVFVAGLLAFVWIRHVFSARAANQDTTLSRIDALEKVLLIAVTVSTFLLPVLYLFTPLLAFADYRPPVVLPALGAATMVASLWLFWRSHADLGKYWSVTLELRADHQLITHGVYRSVRHPMYAAIWLWSLAQALLLQNWLAGWCAMLGFAAMYVLRTPREEAMMCALFGDQYRAYMARTGRVFPRPRSGPKSE